MKILPCTVIKCDYIHSNCYHNQLNTAILNSETNMDKYFKSKFR